MSSQNCKNSSRKTKVRLEGPQKDIAADLAELVKSLPLKGGKKAYYTFPNRKIPNGITSNSSTRRSLQKRKQLTSSVLRERFLKKRSSKPYSTTLHLSEQFLKGKELDQTGPAIPSEGKSNRQGKRQMRMR